jgi:3-oxoacyl-[acyl-carrier-protein] synthase-3
MKMTGIEEIASYIPEKRVSNYDLKEKFEFDDSFIEQKIGVKKVSVKEKIDETSDLCVKAYRNLEKKTDFNKDEIDCVIVVTQNPDYNIPHTSAIVHGKLNLKETCAAFDISLGCSGYVYALSVIESFMGKNAMKKGLLFTADPYSKIIDSNDKNTSILFGDAATVTVIGRNPVFKSGEYNFGTIGNEYENLICQNEKLGMNGRAIFNFAARYVPQDFKLLLEKNDLKPEDIDSFVFHQGSKFIVDMLTRRLKLDTEKVPFVIEDYGNTISSSIPIILENQLTDPNIKKTLICGFGVGLSWASSILTK